MNGIALITGAASGIGREVALTFAERGIGALILIDRNVEQLHVTENEALKIGKKGLSCNLFEVNVSDVERVRCMVEECVTEHGRIDFAVHCAGIGALSNLPIAEMDLELYEKIHNTNAKGTLVMTSELTKVMLKQEEKSIEGRNGRRSIGRGVIVNVTSLNGVIPVGTQGHYGSSKVAANTITQVAASENARKGLRINAVCPTWVDTPMMEEEVRRMPELEGIIERMSPLGRMAKPEEVAELCYFLCSPGASYISGALLPVDAAISSTRGFA